MADIDMPDDRAIERMAEAVHANFRAARRGAEPEGHPALVPWEDLDDALRAQNRDQARDNIVKLATLGFRVVPDDGQDRGSPAAISDDQVEALAREEHDRWAQQKFAQGYRYGPDRVDAGPDKRHPDLVSWEELSEEVRDKDRVPVRQMIGVVRSAGFTVVEDR